MLKPYPQEFRDDVVKVARTAPKAPLVKERLGPAHMGTGDELRIATGTWIERTYPPTWTPSPPRPIDPIEVEMIMTLQTATAA